MTIIDLEKEVDTFLDRKLDKRCPAGEYQGHAKQILNLMLTIYNKYGVRMTPNEAWDVIHNRIVE